MSDFNHDLIADLRANDGHATSGPFVGRPMVILTTVGAKSGDDPRDPARLLARRRPDRHHRLDGRGAEHPSWYHNLVAQPRVTVEIDGERFTAIAHVADGAERRRLYDQHAAINPSFLEYEARTTRVIPVITLQREASSAAA